MNFHLNPEQEFVRDNIISFAQTRLSGGAKHRDKTQEFAPDLWKQCGHIGLLGLCLPKQYGGAGLDRVTTVVALEALGEGCADGGLAFALAAQLLSCATPLALWGTEEQKTQYLPAVCSGERVIANAITEAESGSDAFGLQTKAVSDGSGFRITGTKSFVSNSIEADTALVYAATNSERGMLGGVTAFLIDLDSPGVTRGKPFEKMGLRSCSLGEIDFQEVSVRADRVLGQIGAGGLQFHRSMEWERVGLSAVHIGLMRRLYHVALDYAKAREVSGRKIGDFQSVAHRIADMRVRLEASRLLTYAAAEKLSENRGSTLAASICKLFVSEELVNCAIDVIQTLGGNGYLAEFEVERRLRDAIASKLYSGTSEIQRNLIAGSLGLGNPK